MEDSRFCRKITKVKKIQLKYTFDIYNKISVHLIYQQNIL